MVLYLHARRAAFTAGLLEKAARHPLPSEQLPRDSYLLRMCKERLKLPKEAVLVSHLFVLELYSKADRRGWIMPAAHRMVLGVDYVPTFEAALTPLYFAAVNIQVLWF